jgi:hypothetical protein
MQLETIYLQIGSPKCLVTKVVIDPVLLDNEDPKA